MRGLRAGKHSARSIIPDGQPCVFCGARLARVPAIRFRHPRARLRAWELTILARSDARAAEFRRRLLDRDFARTTPAGGRALSFRREAAFKGTAGSLVIAVAWSVAVIAWSVAVIRPIAVAVTAVVVRSPPAPVPIAHVTHALAEREVARCSGEIAHGHRRCRRGHDAAERGAGDHTDREGFHRTPPVVGARPEKARQPQLTCTVSRTPPGGRSRSVED